MPNTPPKLVPESPGDQALAENIIKRQLSDSPEALDDLTVAEVLDKALEQSPSREKPGNRKPRL